MRRIDRVLAHVERTARAKPEGVTADEVAAAMGLARPNVSADLNALWKDGALVKVLGRPVRYTLPGAAAPGEGVKGEGATLRPQPTRAVKPAPSPAPAPAEGDDDPFTHLVGWKDSLAPAVKQAKAAVLYPGGGLHTLISGPTGVGKSRLVELMFQFAQQAKALRPGARLITFNCADYSHNPQLLLAHLFGVVKGAYTGADRDQVGLVEQADGGILFLDEVHRLVPEGQEMLFRLIDKGLFRRLGESESDRKARTMIVCATTERIDSTLLRTFTRRIPMVINLPSLADRSMRERLRFVRYAFNDEARKMGEPIHVSPEALRCLLVYDCPGNIGQLNSDIQLACAQAFLRFLSDHEPPIRIDLDVLPDHVKRQVGIRNRSRDLDKALAKHETGLLVEPGAAPQHLNEEPDVKLPNFYEMMEQETQRLVRANYQPEAIQAHLTANVEEHFRHFLTKVERRYEAGRQELTAVVDAEVLAAVEQGIALAEGRLRRVVPMRVVFGLALHVSAALERLRLGMTVPYPSLESIRAQHPDEFAAAAIIVGLLSEQLKVALPEGEIGYTALFLAATNSDEDQPRIGLAVACHGEGIAEGMVAVAQHLAGNVGALALDMPLDQSPESILQRLTEWVAGEGYTSVLLLVDMGSLSFLAGQLQFTSGVPVRVVPMASTILLIEAIQQLQLPGVTLDQVYDAVLEAQTRLFPQRRGESRDEAPVLVTWCFTGEGNALLLKNVVEKATRSWGLNAEIMTTSIQPGAEGERVISSLLGGRRPMAVIGPVDPGIPGVPFFTSAEIVTASGQERLKSLLGSREQPADPKVLLQEAPGSSSLVEALIQGLADHFLFSNPHTVIPQAALATERLESELGIQLSAGVRVGLIMHLAALVERRAADRNTVQSPPQLDPELLRLMRCLAPMAQTFQVTFLAEDLLRLHEILTNTLSLQE